MYMDKYVISTKLYNVSGSDAETPVKFHIYQ